jgi:AcrR family transcriptional regulator
MAQGGAEVTTRRVAVLGQTRSRRTRRELVNTAIRLWQSQDFDHITVDAIVAAAGVSKGTFYYHFRRKEDVLVDLGWATVDRVGAEAEAAYRQHGDLGRAIDAGIDGLVRRITAMPRGAVARTIQEFGFRRSSQPPAASGLSAAPSGRHAFLSGLLQAARASGDLSAKVDVDEVADVINYIFIQTILQFVTGGCDEPLALLLRRRTDLVLHGVESTYASSPGPGGAGGA